MPGSLILTGANSSLGIPAVEHLLSTYPEYTAILTVRDASDTDPNTNRLREVIARFPNAKASVHALDLSSLAAVHSFADQIISGISSGDYAPIAAIVANAYYWNLVEGPEITADGFDKTFEVSHISQSALILRLLGSFGADGRVVLLSSDCHWPGKNSMEKYPPVIPDDLDELTRPSMGDSDDKQGRGYHRYATAKLAITTWMYALNRHLQKDPSLSKISAVAINPGNLVDSRALTSNTPVSMHRLQTFVLRPLLPALKMFMGPTLRTAGPAGVDVVEISVNPKYTSKRGFYTLLQEDQSSPDSQNETKQEGLWKKTLEWGQINKGNTALQAAS